MNLIQLGDRLDESSLEKRRPFFQAADTLAKKVFDPAIKKNQLEEYYIQSPRREGEFEDAQPRPDGDLFANLGEYERTLLGKLLHPERKVVCVVGDLGSGKTTTINYIVRRLQKRPCHGCRAVDACDGRRLIFIMDFNKKRFMKANKERRATRMLLEELCVQMRAVLRVHNIPTRAEELSHFWHEQTERLRNGDTLSTAFVRIANELPEKSLDSVLTPPAEQQLTELEFETRTKVLESVVQDKEACLDYLVRLWGYIIRVYYSGTHGCAFMVLDNIDRANPIVQSALLSIVQACASDDGPTFVLLVRPETFNRLGMGTDIIDVEEHQSPRPSDVVVDRLNRFAKDPDSFFLADTGLRRGEFELLKAYLLNVHKLLSSNGIRRSAYLDFLDDACGRSLRLALLTAQRLFRVSEATMQAAEPSPYSLIRLSISQGGIPYKSTKRSSIANLFHVRREGYGRLLAKPRVLKFLGTSPENTSSLNDIRRTLKAFGYEETTLIRRAINEMMYVYCPLIRSDGFDSYSQREFLRAGTQKITLTSIGRGYSDSLLKSVDYVQEVMLDCYVPPDRFGLKVRYDYLSDKFLLLERFLNELRLADVEETNCFRQNRGKSEYLETFGNYLITVDIIWELHQSVRRIVLSMRHREIQWSHYQEVLDRLESLLNVVARDNHEVLGIWPEYRELD